MYNFHVRIMFVISKYFFIFYICKCECHILLIDTKVKCKISFGDVEQFLVTKFRAETKESEIFLQRNSD